MDELHWYDGAPRGRVSLIVPMEPVCLPQVGTVSQTVPKNSSVSSIPVAVNYPVAPGDQIVVTNPNGNNQIFSASAATSPGSTSIPVSPVPGTVPPQQPTALHNFPVGSVVNDESETSIFATVSPNRSAPQGPEDQCLHPGMKDSSGVNVTTTNADLMQISTNLHNATTDWCDPFRPASSTNCEAGATLPDCAYSGQIAPKCNWAGTYIKMANTLMGEGDGNAYLRLAPEAEGNWYTWQYGPDASDWKQYFTDIATVMDEEQQAYNPAYRFTFVWVMGLCVTTTTTNGTTVHPRQAWPNVSGASPVGVIGLDFDNVTGVCSPQSTPTPLSYWQAEQTEQYGFDYWIGFAENPPNEPPGQDIPIALTQWELSGTDVAKVVNKVKYEVPADDPLFIDEVHELATNNDFLFSDYFDVNNSSPANGDSRLSPPNANLSGDISNLPGPMIVDLPITATNPPQGPPFGASDNDTIDVMYLGASSNGPPELYTVPFQAAGGVTTDGNGQAEIPVDPVDPTTLPGTGLSSGTGLPEGAVVIDTNEQSAYPSSAACYQADFYNNPSTTCTY